MTTGIWLGGHIGVKATSLDIPSVVSEAKKQMKQAYYTYIQTAEKKGKLASKQDIEAQYKQANELYAKAKKAVQASGGKSKSIYLRQLDETYREYIAHRVVPYLYAYEAWEAANRAEAAVQTALLDEDLDELQSAYEQLRQASGAEQAKRYYQVYGPQVRQLFLQDLKKTKTLLHQYTADVEAYQWLEQARADLENGDNEKAKQALDAVALLLQRLSPLFQEQLKAEYSDLMEVYDDATKAPVADLDYVEAKNGELTLYFDLPPASLTADDLRITMSINNGAAQIVVPSSIAFNGDKTVAVVSVPRVAPSEENQSVVYTVEYNGQKISADAFTVSKP
ncbi:hypothetical protein ABH20_07110 [Geobacillus sp. T6]|nr:hypothetical protein ABH20_07110 [Geobacillus sp. T6]